MIKFIAILCIILFTKLTLFSSTFAESDNECKKIEEKSPSLRLKKYLFCEYESWFLPTLNEKNRTKVLIGLSAGMAHFDEENGNLELSGRLTVGWHDPHLTWNKSSFGDIWDFPVRSYEMWDPKIIVLSAGNDESINFRTKTACHVLGNGLVTCRPQIRQTIRCQTDFTQWPFDRQNCTLVFSTWLQTSEHINFVDINGLEVDMTFFHPDGEWTLTATRVIYDQRKSSFSKKQEATSPRLSIDFILDRVHNQLRGRYVSPAIIMMVMTLTTLWLDPGSSERLAVACVNVIIHFFCIQDLHQILPHNGSTVPSILIFHANSLVLATIALLLTFVLKNIQEVKIHPPKWISSFTATILRSQVGHIMLLNMLDPKVAAEVEPNADDSNDLVNSNSKTTAWGYVAIVCGWISFLTVFFAYVILYAVLIPNSSMRLPTRVIGYFYLNHGK